MLHIKGLFWSKFISITITYVNSLLKWEFISSKHGSYLYTAYQEHNCKMILIDNKKDIKILIKLAKIPEFRVAGFMPVHD